MNILLVLIPVTALVIVAGVALFFWAVNHQQFDDLDSPGILPLLDDPGHEAAVDAVASLPLPATPPLSQGEQR